MSIPHSQGAGSRERAKVLMRRQIDTLNRRAEALQYLADNLPDDIPDAVDELLWTAVARDHL